MHSVPDALFRTSNYTSGNNCVEVADMPGVSALRDTKRRDWTTLTFNSGEWHAFVQAIKSDML
ncbi:hypothetical protein GCM10009799_22100 [Nocardiopsis rhodophaea]|uniref:DUF397 domain-containing protein n=1 Tax=Nocardiopsis rhodophaea TaxID=280238 RepID=A0ABN2T198_9ACTN